MATKSRKPADGNSTRVEHDALGDVPVPSNRLWGAQTERAHHNFPIGVERFRWGRPVIHPEDMVHPIL